MTMHKIILKNFLSPGDVLVMTAALRDLHKAYPGEHITDIRTACDAIFENSPYITKLKDNEGTVIKMEYPLIHHSGWMGCHFTRGHRDYLSGMIGKPIPMRSMLPEVWISDKEKSWTNQVEQEFGFKGPFWLINAGVKDDYTLKQYHRYQEIIDLLRGKVQFVQVGRKGKHGDQGHIHKPLNGVLDMLGKTDDRQLIRLSSHAHGSLTGVSYLMHLMAAFKKPCVVVAGGREGIRWEMYPNHQYLAVNGCLPCASYDGCWKSKEKDCVQIKDGVPLCMRMIPPEQVARAVENYYIGGMLKYAENKSGNEPKALHRHPEQRQEKPNGMPGKDNP